MQMVREREVCPAQVCARSLRIHARVQLQLCEQYARTLGGVEERTRALVTGETKIMGARVGNTLER